jgi:hypothetical protein
MQCGEKYTVLVQKLQFTRKQSLKLRYTDTITLTLKKVCDRYRKATFIQVETLLA